MGIPWDISDGAGLVDRDRESVYPSIVFELICWKSYRYISNGWRIQTRNTWIILTELKGLRYCIFPK